MKQVFHFTPFLGISCSAHKEQDEGLLYIVHNSINVTLIRVANIYTYQHAGKK
jgi:hypothetical protein